MIDEQKEQSQKWEAPELVELGDVKSLTQFGVGPGIDGNLFSSMLS